MITDSAAERCLLLCMSGADRRRGFKRARRRVISRFISIFLIDAADDDGKRRFSRHLIVPLQRKGLHARKIIAAAGRRVMPYATSAVVDDYI